MNDALERAIQREAADALLNAGVSIPLKEVRLPFAKRPVRLRVTLKRPNMSGQIRFARIYLSMGVTPARMEAFTADDQMRFLADHGDKICRMLACALCAGPGRRIFERPAAWMLKHCVEHRFLVAAIRKFVELMGTDHFTPIIRLADRTNPMKPRLSQPAKGS